MELRFKDSSSSSSSHDALVILKTEKKEEESNVLAFRQVVNIFNELKKADFETKLKLVKWSEKLFHFCELCFSSQSS